MVTRFILTLIIAVQVTTLASVTAVVNRTELYDDESLLLTIRVSPSEDLQQQDLNALESLFFIEQNFRSDSRQIVGGRSTSLREYQFRLRPKKVGALGIPNFRAGSEQSQPILINVLDSRLRTDDLPDDAVLLTASLSSDAAYPDQAIFLNVELAYKIQMRNATIAEFNPDGVQAEVVDEGQTTEVRNGQSYNIYRRTIRLDAESPGLFSLPDIRFSAEYPNTNLGRYMKFGRTAVLDPILVKPIPESYPNNAFWLPLQSFNLTDNLENSINATQFEHLDWQLTQSIEGQPATRLPDVLTLVEASLNSSIKVYKNAPNIGPNTRKDVAAISFTEAGNFELPEIRIPWWNLKTDSLEWATLPSRPVKVKASPSALNSPAASTVPAEQSLTSAITASEVADNANTLWRWATVVLLLAWLSTTGYLIFVLRGSRTESKPSQEEDSKPIHKPSAYLEYLALIRNQLNPKNFIETHLTEEEVRELTDIERNIVEGKTNKEDEKTLNRVVKKLKASRANIQKGSQFNLYPETR